MATAHGARDMRNGKRIAVVIPALNEAASIGRVIEEIPAWADDIVVGDNGSMDGTRDIAVQHGARVAHAERKGYGSACLAAIALVAEDPPDVVVFLDGDYSDNPALMDRLVDPIVRGDTDFVVGSRVLGRREPGALSPQSRWGNALACTLMRWGWGARFTDLGPFRAVRYSSLQRLEMRDPDFGWTVEMQLKSLAHGLRYLEVAVDYRRRLVGRSKVSGTVRGVIGAGYKILSLIGRHALRPRQNRARDSESRRLMIFSRYPVPGHSKTRLIPALGPERAANVHRELAEYTATQARRFGAAEIEVHFTGGEASAMETWLGDGFAYRAQCNGDLGARMAYAFNQAFAEGVDRAVLVGTDCPELGPETYHAAYESLGAHEAVLGPAVDGGYTLIGLRRDAWPRARNLFEGIHWGTDSVLRKTLERANVARLRIGTLAPLLDIDEPSDLEAWNRDESDRSAIPWLSVIVPTRGATEDIGPVLASIGKDPAVEIIVVDASSDKGNASHGPIDGVRVVCASPGRALQMNAGSAYASGEVLLFLHSDTRLPSGFAADIRRILETPGIVAGAFRFATDFRSPSMRVVEWSTNLRARLLQLPYGDQGIFIRKRDFRRLGGFREMPIMDDFEFIRRARRRGTITLARSAATTSGRRWRELGVWRTMLRNQVVVAMYYCGVAPEKLARYYRRGETS